MQSPYKGDFPVLNNPAAPIVYLDNAATTQKPYCVIEKVQQYYKTLNANPLRGLYELSIKATESYAHARHTAAEFIHAKEDCEVIFTRNATESLNLVAYTYGLAHLKQGDEVVVSVMEHHSNMLPWRMAAQRTGAELKYLYPNKLGEITEEEIKAKITDKAKVVAITAVSNVLGIETPLQKIIDYAHEKGSIVVVDGAQAIPHHKVDVQASDVDFYAFSGHKMLAPMGIGVLYGRKKLLEEMPPFMMGGEMVEHVTETEEDFAQLPHKFEAGTPNVAGAIGLEAAIEYYNEIGYETIRKEEKRLARLMKEAFSSIPNVQLYGREQEEKTTAAFNVTDVHPHDTASILDGGHIAIRAGFHCAEPLLQYLEIGPCCRASLFFYNDEEDIAKFADQLKKVRGWLGYGDRSGL